MNGSQSGTYLPLIMFSYAIGLLLLLIGSRTIERAIPRLRGLKELQAAFITGSIAVSLIGLRLWAPPILSIVVANYALFTCFVLIYLSAVRVLASRPVHLPWLIALGLAVLPALCFFIWILPDFLWRIILTTEMLAAVPVAMADLLFRQKCPALMDTASKLAWLQVGSAAFLTARSFLSRMYPPLDFVHGDLIQMGFVFGQLILMLVTVCGIIWLALCERQTELESFALTDSLSGLLNRRAFDEVLTREVERSRGSDNKSALVLIDIDRFKQINDEHGHLVGDTVIVWSAEVLKRAVRPGDTVARYGGDEFAVLLRNADPDQIAIIAERLRNSIEMGAAHIPVKLTASLGVGRCEASETVAEFLNRCDRALYSSKYRGRNCVTIAGREEVKPRKQTDDSTPSIIEN